MQTNQVCRQYHLHKRDGKPTRKGFRAQKCLREIKIDRPSTWEAILDTYCFFYIHPCSLYPCTPFVRQKAVMKRYLPFVVQIWPFLGERVRRLYDGWRVSRSLLRKAYQIRCRYEVFQNTWPFVVRLVRLNRKRAISVRVAT